jgi:dipeptidase E
LPAAGAEGVRAPPAAAARRARGNLNGRHIVAIGGGGIAGIAGDALDAYVLALARRDRPRVLVVPTAWGDDPRSVLQVYDALRSRAEVSHLFLFERNVDDVRSFVVKHDIVWVTGGNTANLLAIWRAQGIDAVMREAWEAGVILAGASAGAACWFEHAGVDWFAPARAALSGLGLLRGSFCPHYDRPSERTQTYKRLVAAGQMAPGFAADDRVALRFAGRELADAVTARPEARAYRVEARNGAAVEIALETRVL